IPLARRRRPARSGPHHRARQHRQSRSRARAQTRSHSRRRQREPDLRLARRPRAAADRHSLRAAREGIPLSYRTLGALIGRPEQVEALARNAEDTMKTIMQRVGTIPPSRRPRVYYARGPRGLETGLGGSINVETIELVAQNVAGGTRVVRRRWSALRSRSPAPRFR